MLTEGQREKLEARRQYLLGWVNIYRAAQANVPPGTYQEKLAEILAEIEQIEKRLGRVKDGSW